MCHSVPPLMGQVGSSELKQNYQDRGVKGTIYVSGRGRMMILIYYHAPLDESGFSLHARLKETKSMRPTDRGYIHIYVYIDENFFCIKIVKRSHSETKPEAHTRIDKLIRRRDFRTKRKRHGFLHTDIISGRERSRSRKSKQGGLVGREVINIYTYFSFFSFGPASTAGVSLIFFYPFAGIESRRASNENPFCALSFEAAYRGGGRVESTPAEHVLNQILSSTIID